MKTFRKIAAIALAAVSFASFDASAAVDIDAAVVLLRTSCEEVPGVSLNNCFTTSGAVVNWILNMRNPKPSASSPVIVDIGPGTFKQLTITCTSAAPGFMTFRGSGPERTTITSSAGNWSPMDLVNCTSMMFQDMTIGPTTGSGPVNGGTIDWKGTGTSRWQNVVVLTDDIYGWQDNTTPSECSSGSRGAHYWFSSRIVATDGSSSLRPYVSRCAEDWFFGSEITISSQNPGAYGGDAFALSAGFPSEIHFYGGVLRVIAPTGAVVPAVVYDPNEQIAGMGAAIAGGGGEIHIHGTGIDVLSADGNPISALVAVDGSEIHADMSAYNLKTGPGGSVTRIVNAGSQVHAPYLWQHMPDPDGNPATAANFSSADGADITTVIASDGKPHMVVYSTSCPVDTPWYDQVDGSCR